MISTKQLKQLGFTQDPIVEVEGFSYQVFKIEHKENYIEVTNEYNASGKLDKQILDYKIKNLQILKNVEKIKTLKKLLYENNN